MALPASRGLIVSYTARSSPCGGRAFLTNVSTIHLWTASRPVTITPESKTGSPTLSSRMASSVRGRVSLRMVNNLLAAHRHAAAAVRPAHVRNRDEEAGREPVHARHLRRQHRRLPAKAHRANAELVGLSGHLLLQPGQQRVGAGLVHLAEQHFLRGIVRGAAVAADGNAEDPRRASLPLRFVHGV